MTRFYLCSLFFVVSRVWFVYGSCLHARLQRLCSLSSLGAPPLAVCSWSAACTGRALGLQSVRPPSIGRRLALLLRSFCRWFFPRIHENGVVDRCMHVVRLVAEAASASRQQTSLQTLVCRLAPLHRTALGWVRQRTWTAAGQAHEGARPTPGRLRPTPGLGVWEAQDGAGQA